MHVLQGVAWECKQPCGAKRNMSSYRGEIEDNKFRHKNLNMSNNVT